MFTFDDYKDMAMLEEYKEEDILEYKSVGTLEEEYKSVCTLEEEYKSVGMLEEDKSVGTLEEDKPVGTSVEKVQETLRMGTQEESGSAAGTAALEKTLC